MTWDGWDTTSPPRRGGRRTPTPARNPDAQRFTSSVTLTTKGATDPEVVDRAREKLAHEIQKLVDRLGFTVTESRWASSPPDLSTGTVIMRLEATGVPRTDGEWPAIRQAIAEDEADRQAASDPMGLMTTATEDAAAAMGRLSDRLDALGAAIAWWSGAEPAARRQGRQIA